MKTAEEIKTIVRTLLENSDLFLVNATVSGENKIEVLIDSPAGVNITTCMENVSYKHIRAHETLMNIVRRLLLEKKNLGGGGGGGGGRG
ncbi:MAG: hypothetical protein K2P54_02410, partial [Odoribacter sp.]|nr:hypothetical protein [Odoribacter sp.]